MIARSLQRCSSATVLAIAITDTTLTPDAGDVRVIVLTFFTGKRWRQMPVHRCQRDNPLTQL